MLQNVGDAIMSTEDDDAEVLTLMALPPDLVLAVLVSVGSTQQLGIAACVCQVLHGSLVEAALRARAKDRGDYIGDLLPHGETSWLQYLCWRERRWAPPCPLAAGSVHSAFAVGGRLFTTGADVHNYGVLGLGPGDEVIGLHTHPLPTRVPLVGDLPAFERVVSVATHSMCTLCLTSGGRLYSFGDGQYGKLGHGDDEGARVPRLVTSLTDVRIVSISAGQQHSLVLSDDGVVYSFGSGFAGKLGHGTQQATRAPTRIAALDGTRVAAVAAGVLHSLVCTRDDGRLLSFGYGGQGQLGHGVRGDELLPKVVEALRGTRIVGLAGGEHHSLVTDDTGGCYSFGAGQARFNHGSEWLGGWLGHGSLEEELAPRRIDTLRHARVARVAAGSRHSVFLIDGGHVYVDTARLCATAPRALAPPARLHARESSCDL